MATRLAPRRLRPAGEGGWFAPNDRHGEQPQSDQQRRRGKDRDRGIRLNGLQPEVVQVGVDGVTEADILVHDEHAEDPYLAFMLSRMFFPDFPVPVGVLRDVERPTHDELMTAQVRAAIEQRGEGSLKKLLDSGETWTVGAGGTP